MNTASARVVSMYFCQALKVTASLGCRCRSEMKSTFRQSGGACSTGQGGAAACPEIGGTAGLMSERYSLFHDHVYDRHIIVVALVTGLDGLDLVDHVRARHHFAKHGVAPALG